MCGACAAYKRCQRCKRDLRLARYSLHTDICESCHRKIAVDIEQRGGGGGGRGLKRALQNVFTEIHVAGPGGEIVDIKDFTEMHRQQIEDHLVNALLSRR